ncbi:MAG: hypothetical protein FGM48_02050 [Candidatus Nanopelagicaceae bacterium]|nr:hypothetical protein [Candidatus Nanopelagicaceae bacterium]
MKKLLALSLLSGLLLAVIPATASSPPKPGTTCSKIGQNQIYNGLKFTCIKSGKKLNWDKGVKILSPKTKFTPTPSPSPQSNLDLDSDGYPKNVPAPGRTCPLNGGTAFFGNQILTCINDHWIYTKNNNASTAPKPSFSPSPLQTTNPKEATNTSAAPGRFCINENSQSAFGNEYLLCIKGVWTRVLGYRISPSNPTVNSYQPKYKNISEKELEKIILAKWAEWKKRKLNKTAEMKIILQDGYTKDWEDVTRETIIYISNVLNGNGLKLVQIPYWVYGETEEFRIRAFNEFAKTASCNPPYMANNEEAIYCATADIGSGGLRISKPGMPVANGYRLSQKDITILTYFVAHDMAIFYVVQTQYGDIAYTGNKYQIPAWIREGSAQLIGLMVANDLRNSGGSYLDLEGENVFVGPKPESICSKDLQDAEGKEKIMPDQCSQAMHLYAVKLLVAKFGGLEALFKFHKLYGQNNDWVTTFKECFGITREDFYKEWWSYLGITESQWPDLLPPTSPERY